jgi:LPXTG-site transpeptidase (sortase) family protein
MQKEKAKKLLTAAVMIYLVSFVVINWNDVSWIFNYKQVGGMIENFFNPYPSIDASSMDAYFYPNHSQATVQQSSSGAAPATVNQTETKAVYTEKKNGLEISKINIEVPIVFSSSTDKNALMKDLDSGAVYYPGSAQPGQSGQIIILGHSAPPGWPKIKHDWIFTNLDKLSPGDTIKINLNNKQYTYIVKKTTIIQKGADVPTDNSLANSSVLTLISCWPPGKDYQRIAVQAVLSN